MEADACAWTSERARVKCEWNFEFASAPSLKFTMAADACAWTCECARVKCEV